jgi:non-ribosomal peptide synthetase component F
VSATPGAGETPPPISVAQEAMWIAGQLAPNQISYNETISIRKDGPCNLDALRAAFGALVRRHAAWRSTFEVVAGQPVQVLHAPPNFELAVLDLSHLEFEEAERRAVTLVAEMSKVPYDLRRGPLLRPRLVKLSDEHHRLYLAMHHLIFDGVSVYRVVLPELVALYDAFDEGRPSPLTEPVTTYADYARWEQEWIDSPRALRRLEHWRTRLFGAPPLSLPVDFGRSATPRLRSALVPLVIPEDTVSGLTEIGQSVGATLFQVLASTWALLLGRYSGSDDVVFATAADLRQRPEFESVVGCSLTPLVVRVGLEGDPSFADLIVRVRNELLDGLDNLVPFERLVRELSVESEPGANPIYQTMIVLEPPMVAPDPAWSVHQMESEIGDAVGNAKLDLELGLDERPEGMIDGRLIYDRDLFTHSSATRMVGHWLALLDEVVADPARRAAKLLGPGSADDRTLAEWNATVLTRLPIQVEDLVEAQAARDADAPAVTAGGQVLTYGELCQRADQTARRLRAAGLGPGAVIALCSAPSAELVISILGVLKAGASYLLLDPGCSSDELDFMVADSGAAAVYADPTLAARLTGQSTPILTLAEPGNGSGSASGATSPEGSDGICCIQYGRTGDTRPRRVPMSHAAVVNLATALAAEVGLGDADKVLIHPDSLFRSSAFDLWGPLSVGATLVIASGSTLDDGAALSRVITAERVSFLHATPERWRALVDTGLKASRGLVALSGGGDLDQELADAIVGRARVLFNAYGTAETTLYATLARVERDRPVTIGRPIANTRAHVLDHRHQPVPIGVVGELAIAGQTVAWWCDNAGRRSARAFVDEPGGSNKAYLTGRKARWRGDGQLELVTARASVAAAIVTAEASS